MSRSDTAVRGVRAVSSSCDVAKCVTMKDEGAGQTSRLRKTWRDVVDKGMNDLHSRPSDAVDHSK